MLTPDQEKMREAAKAAYNDWPSNTEMRAFRDATPPAAILALLDQVEAQGWQPIETAPKDGTAVLVMRNIWPGTNSGRADECNGHNTYVAAWWAGEGSQGSWVCYMDAVHDPRCPIEPTHWMPLPPPPEAA